MLKMSSFLHEITNGKQVESNVIKNKLQNGLICQYFLINYFQKMKEKQISSISPDNVKYSQRETLSRV